MTQAQGMRQLTPRPKDWTAKGTRSKAVLQLGPAPKTRKNVSTEFLFGGWEVGLRGREATVLEACSKSYNQMLSKSARKSQDYRPQNPLFLLSHLTHSTLPVTQSQGSSLGYRSSQSTGTGSHHSGQSAGPNTVSLQGHALPGLKNTNSQIAFWSHCCHSTLHIRIC